MLYLLSKQNIRYSSISVAISKINLRVLSQFTRQKSLRVLVAVFFAIIFFIILHACTEKPFLLVAYTKHKHGRTTNRRRVMKSSDTCEKMAELIRHLITSVLTSQHKWIWIESKLNPNRIRIGEIGKNAGLESIIDSLKKSIPLDRRRTFYPCLYWKIYDSLEILYKAHFSRKFHDLRNRVFFPKIAWFKKAGFYNPI